VSALRENLACGIGLIIEHEAFGRFTAYCHMQKRLVGFDQQVKRGQIVGRMGDTGDAATCRPIRPCPHVHFELVADGASHAQAIETVTFDPLAFSAGCFDPRKSYPTDRLVLTHPVRC
jgi:murein DD-endopeptidase MepM/ murein hydrolase activator NlpD